MKKIFILFFALLLSITSLSKVTYLEGINVPKIIQKFQENGYTYIETNNGTYISLEKDSHNFRRGVKILRKDSKLPYAIHIKSSHNFYEPNCKKVKENLKEVANLLCENISNKEIVLKIKELSENIEVEDPYDPNLDGKEQANLYNTVIETKNYEIISSNFGSEKQISIELKL